MLLYKSIYMTQVEFKQIAEKFGFTTFSIAPWDETIGIYVEKRNKDG